MKEIIAICALLVTAQPQRSENLAYNGKWESIHPLPFFKDEKGLAYMTSEKLWMEIIRDSIFIREKFSTDFSTDDSCTRWPQHFFYKGRITIRNHYVEISGTATDSTFKKTVNKCRGDSQLSVASTFAAIGDTVFFNFPRFDYNWAPHPIALLRTGKSSEPKTK
jgi:hypothetical protein